MDQRSDVNRAKSRSRLHERILGPFVTFHRLTTHLPLLPPNLETPLSSTKRYRPIDNKHIFGLFPPSDFYQAMPPDLRVNRHTFCALEDHFHRQ